MSPELRAFLAAADLDDLGDARGDIKTVNETDAAAVRSVLELWRDRQAIANLLFRADVIPQDLRIATLLRGFGEKREPYFVLAAACGVSKIDAAKFPAEDRKRIMTELVAIVRSTNDIRTQRASLSLQEFAVQQDAAEIIGLLAHPDKLVRNNLRNWLFRMLRDRGLDGFAEAAHASSLRADVRREVVADFKDYLVNPDGSPPTLFSYIPNLGETTADTWKQLDPPLAQARADGGA
jgi:hypothetical protein